MFEIAGHQPAFRAPVSAVSPDIVYKNIELTSSVAHEDFITSSALINRIWLL